jgi:hypothetical protein
MEASAGIEPACADLQSATHCFCESQEQLDFPRFHVHKHLIHIHIPLTFRGHGLTHVGHEMSAI